MPETTWLSQETDDAKKQRLKNAATKSQIVWGGEFENQERTEVIDRVKQNITRRMNKLNTDSQDGAKSFGREIKAETEDINQKLENFRKIYDEHEKTKNAISEKEQQIETISERRNQYREDEKKYDKRQKRSKSKYNKASEEYRRIAAMLEKHKEVERDRTEKEEWDREIRRISTAMGDRNSETENEQLLQRQLELFRKKTVFENNLYELEEYERSGGQLENLEEERNKAKGKKERYKEKYNRNYRKYLNRQKDRKRKEDQKQKKLEELDGLNNTLSSIKKRMQEKGDEISKQTRQAVDNHKEKTELYKKNEVKTKSKEFDRLATDYYILSRRQTDPLGLRTQTAETLPKLQEQKNIAEFIGYLDDMDVLNRMLNIQKDPSKAFEPVELKSRTLRGANFNTMDEDRSAHIKYHRGITVESMPDAGGQTRTLKVNQEFAEKDSDAEGTKDLLSMNRKDAGGYYLSAAETVGVRSVKDQSRHMEVKGVIINGHFIPESDLGKVGYWDKRKIKDDTGTYAEEEEIAKDIRMSPLFQKYSAENIRYYSNYNDLAQSNATQQTTGSSVEEKIDSFFKKIDPKEMILGEGLGENGDVHQGIINLDTGLDLTGIEENVRSLNLWAKGKISLKKLDEDTTAENIASIIGNVKAILGSLIEIVKKLASHRILTSEHQDEKELGSRYIGKLDYIIDLLDPVMGILTGGLSLGDVKFGSIPGADILGDLWTVLTSIYYSYRGSQKKANIHAAKKELMSNPDGSPVSESLKQNPQAMRLLKAANRHNNKELANNVTGAATGVADAVADFVDPVTKRIIKSATAGIRILTKIIANGVYKSREKTALLKEALPKEKVDKYDHFWMTSRFDKVLKRVTGVNSLHKMTSAMRIITAIDMQVLIHNAQDNSPEKTVAEKVMGAFYSDPAKYKQIPLTSILGHMGEGDEWRKKLAESIR